MPMTVEELQKKLGAVNEKRRRVEELDYHFKFKEGRVPELQMKTERYYSAVPESCHGVLIDIIRAAIERERAELNAMIAEVEALQ
jgi:hypothetical protein